MISLRPAEQRGLTQNQWLESYHSFSFGSYVSQQHQGFSSLRVINQDIIQPGQGFGMHAHREMEILTYVLQGTLTHRDSLGNHGFIQAGELQRMTAGTGIVHSEFNDSPQQPVELLQIWILPGQAHLPPSYEQMTLPHQLSSLQLIASNSDDTTCLHIHQDVKLFRGRLDTQQTSVYRTQRNLWLQLISGQLQLNNLQLKPGDGAAVEGESELKLFALNQCEFLLFDLA
jgi:redox-sensitive bicupin YhaK (pirin superfamily)